MSAPLSLRRRLLLRLIPAITLVLILNAILGYSVGHYFANKVYDQWLLDSALSLKRQVRIVADRAELNLSASTLDLFAFDEIDQVYFDVVTPNGGRRAGNAEFCQPPINDKAAERIEFFDTSLDGKAVRMVQVNDRIIPPSTSISEPFSPFTICVAETTRKRHTLQNELIAALFLPQAGLLFAIGFAVWRAVSSTTDSLRDAVRLVRAQPQTRTLANEVTAAAPVEVHPLLDELNDLIAAVRGSVEHERRFIDHAAHQLRTPLAALRLDLETLNTAQPGADVVQRPALERSLQATRRLDHLLTQLLLLARLDAGESSAIAMKRIDLNARLRIAEARVIDAAINDGKEIELTLSGEALEFSGVEILVDELITNLIDNALRYSPPGATIFVQTDAKRQTLLVSNGGNTVGAETVKRMGERFFRATPGETEGSGLGLSIVKEIAKIHRARVAIAAGESGGIAVTVFFPASEHDEAAEIAPQVR